jgi:hypothetical protein
MDRIFLGLLTKEDFSNAFAIYKVTAVPVNAHEVDTEQAATYARAHLLRSIEGFAWFTKVTNSLKIVLQEIS